MKAARADQRVDLRHGQVRHSGRRGGALEEFDGRRKADFIASADGDDAPDKLLKHAPEAALRKLEHGCSRVLADRRADTAQDLVDIERLLSRHAQIERRCTARAVASSLVEAAGVEPASESSEAWLLHACLTFGVSSASCPVSGERARTSL